MRGPKRVFIGAVVVALVAVALSANAAQAASSSDKRSITIASGANGGFAVWQDSRNGDADVYGSRIDASGKVLDPNGIAIAKGFPPGNPDFPGQFAPRIAWNGTNYLVTWIVDTSLESQEIEYVYLDANGKKVGALQYINDSGALFGDYDVAASDGHFLIVWNAFASFGEDWINGQLLPENKDVSVEFRGAYGDDPQERAFGRLALAGGKGAFLLAYEKCVHCADEASPRLPHFIQIAKVTLAGKVVSASVLTNKAKFDELAPAVAWDGTRWLVAWEDHRGPDADIYGSRLLSSMQNLDPGGDPIGAAAGGQLVPAVTASGSTFYVTWTDWRNPASGDIYGQRVSTLGALQNGASGFLVSNAAKTQRDSDVAPIGQNITAVWEDLRANSPDLFAANISPTAVLTPNGFPISQ